MPPPSHQPRWQALCYSVISHLHAFACAVLSLKALLYLLQPEGPPEVVCLPQDTSAESLGLSAGWKCWQMSFIYLWLQSLSCRLHGSPSKMQPTPPFFPSAHFTGSMARTPVKLHVAVNIGSWQPAQQCRASWLSPTPSPGRAVIRIFLPKSASLALLWAAHGTGPGLFALGPTWIPHPCLQAPNL